MSSRFRRDTSHSAHSANRFLRNSSDGFGEWWAAIGVVALATIAALSVGSKSPITDKAGIQAPAAAQPASAEAIARSIQTAQQRLSEIDRSLKSLCNEPVLIALELAPDCKTGAMTIVDGMFDGPGGNLLNRRAREDVRAAVTEYLEALRRKPILWKALDSIEIRGHSDPRAYRNAYTTNLVGSQQRALGVLYFLTGKKGLGQKDKEDLQRLAAVSGVSFSRPPTSCPEKVRECYAQWRRVEILPVFSESQRREEWSQTVDSVQSLVQRQSAETP